MEFEARKRTPQEEFWSGPFGSAYTDRNAGATAEAAATQHLGRMLQGLSHPVGSVLELGANRGLNIVALRRLLPNAEFDAVEINGDACDVLREIGCRVQNSSLLDFAPASQFDLVLISGVLIQLAPESLSRAYSVLERATRRTLLISEYYNPTPVEVEYRGHAGRLFKRDFAGEFLDAHPAFVLRDYGFIYHRDLFPADDVTWFRLERSNA